MGASAENFCLRWNDFHSNVSGSFRELRAEADFFDVTLATSDGSGRTLQAHKVILSACSNFFKEVLREQAKIHSHPNPMIYLRGVNFNDLHTVLDFMYHGEVNIAHDDLTSFLSVAEELQIKGLTNKDEAEAGEPPQNKLNRPLPGRDPGPSPKRSRKSSSGISNQGHSTLATSLPSTSLSVVDPDIKEIEVKMDPEMLLLDEGPEAVMLDEEGYDDSYGDYFDDATGGMEGDDGQEEEGANYSGSKGSPYQLLNTAPTNDATCHVCNKMFSNRKNAMRHFREQHANSERKSETFECPVCHKSTFTLKRYLRDHVLKAHGISAYTLNVD